MRWLSFFILAYVCLGLQLGLARAVEFKTAVPDFVLAAVVFIALNAPRDTALLACFVLGFLRDLGGESTLGLYALSYGIAAVIVLGLRQATRRSHPLTHFFLTLSGAIAIAIIFAVHGWIRPEHGVRAPTVPLFYSAIYSALIAPIGIGILQKLSKLFRFRRDLHG